MFIQCMWEEGGAAEDSFFDSKSRLYRFVVSEDIIYPWWLSVAKNEPPSERADGGTQILIHHNKITKMKNFGDAIAFALAIALNGAMVGYHMCECVYVWFAIRLSMFHYNNLYSTYWISYANKEQPQSQHLTYKLRLCFLFLLLSIEFFFAAFRFSM